MAIATMGETSSLPRISLAALIDFIDAQDPELLNAIGKLNPKLLGAVVQDLQTLEINTRTLLAANAPILDIGELLGLGEHARPGKTRVSVISTKALGEGATGQFWIARLLVEVARFGSRHPHNGLQAVVFLDEADLYLPATSKPAAKGPLENLFKRARSFGIGMMIATQTPGDIDYKSKDNISTWLVGRVNQPQGLKKLRTVFLTSPTLVDRLPGFGVGRFLAQSPGTSTLEFTADLPCVIPTQLDEDRIFELAREPVSVP